MVGGPDSVERGSGTSERLIFFSDAVVAIAITLLALELPVPEGESTSSLLRSLRSSEGHYVAFLLSFVVIAMAWNEHYQTFRFLERTDSRLRGITFFWLLMIVLNPFATKLLTIEGGDSVGAHAIRYSFYSLIQVLSSAAMLASTRHMITNRLASPEAPDAVLARSYQRFLGPMLGFGLSIPVFFATKFGWVLWIAVPVTMAILRRLNLLGNHTAPTAAP